MLASSIEILGVYDYWRIIEKNPWLLADYSHKSDYLKIIAGGKCDIYITQREALASSIEILGVHDYWKNLWLLADNSFQGGDYSEFRVVEKRERPKKIFWHFWP